MKAVQTKTTSATTAKKNTPFFSKEGGQDFFHTAVNEQSFFSKVTQPGAIQAKLTVGKPNDRYEREADKMADQVVQRLGETPQVITKSEHQLNNKSNFIKPKPAGIEPEKKEEEVEETGQDKLLRKPIFEPPPEDEIQCKCAHCEEEGKQEKQEEKNGEEEKEKLQKKSIFESNEETTIQQKSESLTQNLTDGPHQSDSIQPTLISPSTATSVLQAKCAACEHEEKQEVKEEEKGEEPKEKLQKKPIFESNEEPTPQQKSEPLTQNLYTGTHQTESAQPVIGGSVVQAKCAACEHEENQEKKEEENGEPLKEKLQKKPIFESNEEPTLQQKSGPLTQNLYTGTHQTETTQPAIAPTSIGTPVLQAKCAACEHEEKQEKKEEENGEETKEKLQKKPIFESNEEKTVQTKPEPFNGKQINLPPATSIQAKLTVGHPDDPYERQADAMADKVVQRLAEPAVQKNSESLFNNITPLIQRRCRECEEGPEVFLKPESILQRSNIDDNAPNPDGSRESIVATARTMLGKIESKHDDGTGKRVGAEYLLEIFHLAAPGVWDDATIENSNGQIPSWCGIFAVWAHKKAGKDIGTWQMGKGVSAFGTITQTTTPQPGDIGYIDQPFQHHCIVVKVEGTTVHSIDGNSGLFSEVKENQRSLSEYTGFFTAFGASGEPSVQKKEEDNNIAVQAKADDSASVPSSIEQQLSTTKGSGSPLPESIRNGMEQNFGADFSEVKIHTDSSAVQMSKNLHAQAFTHGSDIYFNTGKYDSNSTAGQRLLAHELTHTIQQGGLARRNTVPNLQKKDEKLYNLVYQFKGEVIFLGLELKETALKIINSNPDSEKLIKQGLDKVFHYNGDPVYETPAFLKTTRVINLIKAGIEAWPGTGVPSMKQLDDLITKRSQALHSTLFLEKVNLHLKTVHSIDPSFIDWNLLIPQLKNDVFMWEAKNALEASEFDQYEWVLDLMIDEVKGFDPVVGAKTFDAVDINKKLYPFIVNNDELFSQEVIQEHSEKFVMPWLEKIKHIKYIPDNFSIKSFEPGDDVRKAEMSREKLLKDFIEKEVPDIMFRFVLDQWTKSGVNPDIWLKNLNIDSYKAILLNQLTETFLQKAKQDPAYLQALKLQASEKTKFNIIRLFYFSAHGMQSSNATLKEEFSKGFKEEMEEDMVALLENPAEYYELSVKIASATTTFLSTIQPDRSIANETFELVTKITNALKVPKEHGALLVFFIAIGNYIKEYQTAIEEEKTKIKEAIKARIQVDYDGIAKVVKNWKKVAEDFMEKKFKPMLKTVALEWLANNKKEIQKILANYDTANAKYALQMNEGAKELEGIAEGLVNDEYEEVEYEGEVITKKDLPQLRTIIQFMRDEANARLSTKNAEKEKGKLREALDVYDEVREDIIDDEFDWLDYTEEIFVEARKRLGIGEFPKYTTYYEVFTAQVVAEKSPFLAMVIANWYWKENSERKMAQVFKVVGLGLLTIGAMFVPGAAGFVIAALDIGVGIGMGVKGVVDAKEILRMAKLDIHGTIRGVSVEEAEKAVKHAWFGLAITVVLTVGPIALSRALRVRGAGGVKLNAETRAWEKSLNKGTRDALKGNPALRKIYAEMDESVRALLTLCDSPCIPLGFGPKPEEIARIKDFMKNVKVPQNHRGLREYLHHPSRRADLTAAMDGLKDVKSLTQLEARLERAIAANVKQAGASANKVNGIWHYTRPDGIVVKEYEIARHGDLSVDRGTSRFFQSHHGIQDAWAMGKGIPGYARDDCPAILLRDSKMGTPHQTVSARQSGRFGEIGSRTYAQERELMRADMKAGGVVDSKANQLLIQSDTYFGKLYRQIEATGKTTELTRIFGTWKPKT